MDKKIPMMREYSIGIQGQSFHFTLLHVES
jgi:hypothetical protein